MAFKGMNVNLSFTADTSKAKKELQDLKNQLASLTQSVASSSNGLGLSKDINEAVQSAQKLKIVLDQATTSNGKLDLSAFNNGLKQSNMTIQQYANSLNQLGPQGQQAFAQMAQAVAMAEMPLRRTNGLINSMWESLQNVARYQITTSILTGFTSSIQTAFRYAEDLNESLNKIQIVSGQSSQQMAEFASRANKAAQALSATTTQYTDAALIFYQQGLDKSQVEERTNAVIKMAHATGDAASEVASYMTAIWNNFDDGAESLEHYADVITALGASTASSSSEIAEGLSKFASIAKTTGLSYEYATSALATLVANTRQSADTIGNSLKTIFSRLQGVQLGDTLEDGVNLNKYSAALQKVGVDILDVSGNMKSLDQILDELAGKWQTLSNAEQTALAQTVGGTRQYTQLISLMNHWGDMQTNLTTAYSSTGTLNEQASIYAEGWEAAKDRVTAALEEIYSKLIDDKFFIDLLNFTKNFANEVSVVIDSIGGLQGVIATVGALITQIFNKQISSALEGMAYNFKVNFGIAQREAVETKKAVQMALADIGNAGVTGGAISTIYKQQAGLQSDLLSKTEELRAKKQELSAIDQQLIQSNMDIAKQLGEQAIKAAQVREELENTAQSESSRVVNQAALLGINSTPVEAQLNSVQDLATQYGALDAIIVKLDSFRDNTKDAQAALKEMLAQLSESGGVEFTATDAAGKAISELLQELATGDFTAEQFKDKLLELRRVLGQLDEGVTSAAMDLEENFENHMQASGQSADVVATRLQNVSTAIDQVRNASQHAGAAQIDYADKMKTLETQIEKTAEAIKNAKAQTATISQVVTSSASALMSFSSMLSTVAQAFKTFHDVDATPVQKLTAAISVLTTTVFTLNAVKKVAQGINSRLAASLVAEAEADINAAKAKLAKAQASKGTALATQLEAEATELETIAAEKNAKAEMLRKAALGGVGLALLGVVAVLAVAVAAWNAYDQSIKNADKAQAKESELAVKQAKESTEKVKKLKEEVKAFEEAQVEYKKAVAIGGDVTTAKDKLAESARKLAEVYKEEYGELQNINVELAIAQGNYEGLSQAILQAEQARITGAIADNEEAIKQQTITTGKKILSTGRSYNLNGTSSLNHSISMGATGWDEGWRTEAGINWGEFSHISPDYSPQGDSGLSIFANNTDEDLIAAYEEALKLRAQLQEWGKKDTANQLSLNESETYQGLLTWIDEISEVYDELKTLKETGEDLKIQEILLNPVGDLDVHNITNYGDYDTLVGQLANKLAEEIPSLEGNVEKARAIVDSYLALDPFTKEYAINDRNAQTYIDKLTGKGQGENGTDKQTDWTGKREELQSFYESLSDDQRTLFIQVDFDRVKNTETFEQEISRLQNIANAKTAAINLSDANSLLDTYGEKGAKGLKDKDIDWTKGSISINGVEQQVKNFDEFLRLSAADQVQYLQSITDTYAAEASSQVTTAQSSIETILKSYGFNEDEIKERNFSRKIDGVDYAQVNVLKSTLQTLDGLQTSSNSGFTSLVKNLKDIALDSDKIEALKNTWDSTKDSVLDYQDAILDVIASSSQLSATEKQIYLNTLAEQTDETFKNSDKYKHIILDIAKSGEGMTLSEKMTLINNEISSGLKNAQAYGQDIAAIIASDTNSTSQQKIAALNDELQKGLITVEDYATSIAGLDGLSPTQKLMSIGTKDQVRERILANLRAQYQDSDADMINQKADEQTTEAFQTLVDSLTATDFTSIESLTSFMSTLPDGVSMAEKLPAIFNNIASNVTSLKDLTNLQSIMYKNGFGANSSQYAETTSIGLQKIAAQYSECKDALLAYQTALASGVPTAISSTENALQQAVALEEVAVKYNTTSKAIKAYKELTGENNDTAAAKMLAQNAAMEKLIQNYEKYASIGNKYGNKGLAGISTSDLSVLTEAQETFKAFFKVEELGLDDTLKLTAALDNGKDAFMKAAAAAGLSADEAGKYYDKMQRVAKATDEAYYTSLKYDTALNTLNGHLSDGTITAQKYWELLQKILSGQGNYTTAGQIQALNDKIKEGLHIINPDGTEGDLMSKDQVLEIWKTANSSYGNTTSPREVLDNLMSQFGSTYQYAGEDGTEKTGVFGREVLEAAMSYLEKDAANNGMSPEAIQAEKQRWYDMLPKTEAAKDMRRIVGQSLFKDIQQSDMDASKKGEAYQTLNNDQAIEGYQFATAMTGLATESGNGLTAKERLNYIEEAASKGEISAKKFGEALKEVFDINDTPTVDMLKTMSDEIDKGNMGAKEYVNILMGIDDKNLNPSERMALAAKAGEQEYNQNSLEFDNWTQEGFDAARLAASQQAFDQLTSKNFSNIGEAAEFFKNLDSSLEGIPSKATAVGNSLMQNASTLDELSKCISLVQENQGTVDYDAYSSSLLNMASKYDNCTEEIERYNAALNAHDKQATAAAEAQLVLATKIGEVSKKFNLSSEDVEDYYRNLRSMAQYTDVCDQELVEIAKDQLRYDRAVTNTTKNLKNWQKALNGTSKTGRVAEATIREIGEAYGDLLDLDGTNLSQDFKTNAHNLELLNKAVNGTPEEAAAAYDELQKLAQADIETHLQLTGNEEFQSAKNDVLALREELYGPWDDVKVGAELNDESFLQALSDMVNAAGMTAQQATDYLSSMGVDAEVVEDTSKKQTSSTYTGAVANDKPLTGTWSLPLMGGGSWSVPSITYTETPMKTEGELEGGGFALKVTSAHKSSGGNMKHSQTSGGGGRSGGGGGRERSRRQKQPIRYNAAQEKNVTNEIERYHHIKNSLESIAHELNMISKAKDKAFGKDRLKAIQQETDALNEQKKRQEEYLKEIQDWSKRDAAAAQSIGLQLDAEGHVTNYEQKMTDWINDYNKALRDANKMENQAVDWWNSLSADDQEKEENSWAYEEKVNAAKRIAEAAEKEYEDRTKILSQYEETMDLLDSEREKYQDIIDAIRDSMLEKITYAVELKVEVADDALAILQDYLNDIGDKADGAADALANFAKQAEQVQKQVSAYQGGVQDILGLAGAGQGLINRALTNQLTAEDWAEISNLDLKADDVSNLEDYMNSLLGLNQKLRDLRTEALEKVTMAFDEYNSELEKSSEKIEHLQKVNQTYINIIDIVGKKTLDASGQLSKALNQANFEMQRNNTHALKAELEFIDSSISDTERLLKQAREAGASNEVIKSLEEDLKTMNDTRDATYEKWLDSWEAECQAAADIYTQTLEAIVSNFEDSIAGAATSLSVLQAEFDRQKQINETYLDEYDQIYQLSKLTRDINNSIDETDNIKSKKALKKLSEEINQIQEDGTELSQYDLDVLRKKYELELALDKLDEARNSKTAVRMTRDSEGNFGYVYTADQDAVRKAEQEYEDKLYAMQQLNSEYIDSMQEQILQAEQECSAALAELNVSDYATYEEYQAAALQVQEDYGKLVEDYYKQLENAVGNNKELYEGAWSEYSAATGYQLGQEEKFITDFVDTQLARLTDFNTIQDASLAFNAGLNDAMNEASKAWAEWYTNTQIALSDGGTSIGTYSDSVTEAISGENGLLSQAAAAEEAAQKMSQTYQEAFADILKSLKDFIDQWDELIQQQITTDKLLATTIYDIIATQAGEKASLLRDSQSDTVGFDTGGYTGNWNSSDGKLAILHQKELILNAEDTQNILNAVDTVRYMSNILDLNAMSASSGFANALQSSGIASTANTETIEQNVSITAEFKDATTANEITEALDNIINLASQYAHRKI